MSVTIETPVDALVSFHYLRRDEKMAQLASFVETGKLRLIGDSGAYSAMTQGAAIELSEFAAWCRQWQRYFFWTASLDVIYNPIASFRNWTTLRDKYGLNAVPTVHSGTDFSWFDAYAREGVDMMGLGGMVGGKGSGNFNLKWAAQAMRYTRDKWPDLRFHLWGVTNRAFLNNLPVYSADSSGAIGAGYRYGQLMLFDPKLARVFQVDIGRTSAAEVYRYGNLLRTNYGVDPADVRRAHVGNRTMLATIAIKTTQQYAAWLRARHRVSPPKSLLDGGAEVGTRIHVAETNPKDLLLPSLDGPRIHVVESKDQDNLLNPLRELP